MVEVTFRVPTKANKFGYIEVSGPLDEVMASGSDPETIGRVYDQYVRAFQKGETAASVAAANAAVVADVSFATGPEKGTQEDAAVDLLTSELGATVVATEGAPWNKPQPEAESKPWETSGPPAAVADIDWS